LYESYFKCGSARNFRIRCCRKYPGSTISSIRGKPELIKKVKSTVSPLDKQPVKKPSASEEKLYEIGATFLFLFMSMGRDEVSKLRSPTNLLFIPRYVIIESHGGMILTG
jgi:hypothetical protein